MAKLSIVGYLFCMQVLAILYGKLFFFLTFFCLFFSNKQIHINMGATYIHINTTIHEVITIKTKFKYKFGL